MNKILKKAALGAAAASLVLALGACGTTTIAASGQIGAAGEPKDGGTITFGLDRDVATLDPAKSAITSQPTLAVANALFDPLMAYGPDGSVEPYLAKSFEAMDATQTKWLLKLHDGVKFTDGSPLNAAAVVSYMEHLAKKETACSCRGDVLKISKSEAVNETDVEFTLAAPNAAFPKGFTRQMGYIASTTAKDAFGFPIGSGPYQVKDYKSGDAITMARNENYWGKKAHADTIVFKSLPDTDSRYQSLVSGAADIIWTESASQFNQAELDGMDRSTATTGTSLGVFNSRTAPFDNPAARKAVSMAIDPGALLKVVNEGTGVVAAGPITSTSSYEATAKAPGHDTKEAARIAASLPTPLSFEYLTDGRPQSQARAVAIQQMLAEVGITMTIKATDLSQFGAALVSGNFQMVDFTTSLFGDTENAFTSMYPSDGLANFSGYKNATVDTLVAESKAEPDAAKRGLLYNQIAERGFQDVPFTFYTENLDGFILDPKRIGGVADVSSWSLVSIRPSDFWSPAS